jgi:hypothetical protein
MRTWFSDQARSREKPRRKMTYFAFSLVPLWFLGLIFFAGRALNFTRLVLNNLAPGERYFGSADFSAFHVRYQINATTIEHEKLTEAGRQYQKRAIRNQRMMIAWGVCGFILIASLLSHIRT